MSFELTSLVIKFKTMLDFLNLEMVKKKMLPRTTTLFFQKKWKELRFCITTNVPEIKYNIPTLYARYFDLQLIICEYSSTYRNKNSILTFKPSIVPMCPNMPFYKSSSWKTRNNQIVHNSVVRSLLPFVPSFYNM